VVINPWFLGAFLGTAGVCAVLVVIALINWQDPGAALLLTGALLYLVGTFLVTMLFNVPLNDALAAVPAESTESAGLWQRYLTDWTNWNHVRTIAALAAAALLTLGLRL
jgi:uncharacterized membrane protein